MILPEPHQRSYKVGHRDPKLANNNTGQASRNRWAWTIGQFGQFVLWADFFRDEDNKETDEVKDLRLLHIVPNRKSLPIPLANCTEEELLTLKHFLNTAIEWALPIARQRDKEAQDAFDNGDDSHMRIYRKVPTLVYRARPEFEHGEGVQHRSENASDLSRDGNDQSSRLSEHGPGVAEHDEDYSSAQDDRQETD